MNHPRLPRALIILLFILVIVTFLVGSVHSFASARAASIVDGSNQNSRRPRDAQVSTLAVTVSSATLEATFTGLPALYLPPPIEASTSVPTPSPTLLPTGTPAPVEGYITDMTGIITLGILLVVVILVGVTWGERGLQRKKNKK